MNRRCPSSCRKCLKYRGITTQRFFSRFEKRVHTMFCLWKGMNTMVPVCCLTKSVCRMCVPNYFPHNYMWSEGGSADLGLRLYLGLGLYVPLNFPFHENVYSSAQIPSRWSRFECRAGPRCSMYGNLPVRGDRLGCDLGLTGDNEADIIDACPRVPDHRVSAVVLSHSTLNPWTHSHCV